MSRDRGVTMGPEEIRGLLDDARTVTLGTSGPDGRPHLASMWFALDGERVVMWTYGASQKARNLARDPRATVLAEAGQTYTELRGVTLDCDVELVRDEAAVLGLGRLLHARNAAGSPADEASLRAQAAKRVGLVLTVVRTRNWDHRRLVSNPTAQGEMMRET